MLVRCLVLLCSSLSLSFLHSQMGTVPPLLAMRLDGYTACVRLPDDGDGDLVGSGPQHLAWCMFIVRVLNEQMKE